MMSDLILNPHLELDLRKEEGNVEGRLVWPFKGRGLQTLPLNSESRLRLLRKILELKNNPRDFQKWYKNQSRLQQKKFRETGLAVARQEASKPAVFRCDLERVADAVMPAAPHPALSPTLEDGTRRHLRLSEKLYYDKNGGTPPFLSHRARESLSALHEGPTVWSPDPSTGIYFPFHLSGDIQRHFEELLVKKTVHSLEPRLADLFLRAHILIDERDLRKRSAVWKKNLAEVGRQLRANGFTLLPPLLHEFHLQSLKNYYGQLIEEGWVYAHDPKVPQRSNLYGEPLGVMIHQQMGPLISKIMGENWVSSYSYWAAYRAGSELKRHVDREACELTLSTLIDFMAPEGGLKSWPLYLEPSGQKAVKLEMDPGQAVLFKGREIPHFRPKLPPGHRSMSRFFHFVPEGSKHLT